MSVGKEQEGRHQGECPKAIYDLLIAQIRSEQDKILEIAQEKPHSKELQLRISSLAKLYYALDWFVDKVITDRRGI